MERSARGIWQQLRRRRQTGEDAATGRAEQPAVPASAALSAPDDPALSAPDDPTLSTPDDPAASTPGDPTASAPDDPALSADGDSAPTDRVPSSLLAAARDCPPRGATLRLAVGDTKVIAVVGGVDGDPYEWWDAIQWLAAPSGAGREAG
jgi:hypothetical protein